MILDDISRLSTAVPLVPLVASIDMIASKPLKVITPGT